MSLPNRGGRRSAQLCTKNSAAPVQVVAANATVNAVVAVVAAPAEGVVVKVAAAVRVGANKFAQLAAVNVIKRDESHAGHQANGWGNLVSSR